MPTGFAWSSAGSNAPPLNILTTYTNHILYCVASRAIEKRGRGGGGAIKGFLTTQLGGYRLQENCSLFMYIILDMFKSSYLSHRHQSRLGVSKGFLFKNYHNDVTKTY